MIGALLARMSQSSSHPVMIFDNAPCTNGQLLQEVEVWDGRLNKAGIAAGAVVAVVGEYSPSTCAVFLALVKRRCVVVPLSRSSAPHHATFLDIAQAGAVIDVEADADSSVALCDRQVSHPLTRQLIETGSPGLILFSSGSTGSHKAILHDFGRLMQRYESPGRQLRTLAFLLFDHIGGINTLFYALANGGTVVAVPSSREVDVVCRAIQEHNVELLPTSPTFLNMVLISEAYRRHDLSSLKVITYGTEVMPESTLHELARCIPQAQLRQTYGLTELGILHARGRETDSTWMKFTGGAAECKVVDGVLWIRSKSAMLGYLNTESPFDADGWMNTRDRVEVDGEYVRVVGRESDIINVGGEKVFPAEVESVLLQAPNIRDATVYAEKNAVTGHVVAACVNIVAPEDPRELKLRLRRFCAERLPRYKVPIKIEIADDRLYSARYKKDRNRFQRH